jgi:hypothetical protein
MIKEIFAILFLFIPLISEVMNDAKGDLNKLKDVWVRFFLTLVGSMFAVALTDHNYLLALNLSLAIHFFLFDYIVTAVLIKNKVIEVSGAHWFSYMGKSSKVDNISWWRNMNPWGRFAIRLGYFIGSLVLYFKV